MVTEASGAMRDLHHRMPVIVAEADHDTWLGGEPDAAAELMRPWDGALDIVPVSRRVNSVKNDDESLLAPADGAR